MASVCGSLQRFDNGRDIVANHPLIGSGVKPTPHFTRTPHGVGIELTTDCHAGIFGLTLDRSWVDARFDKDGLTFCFLIKSTKLAMSASAASETVETPCRPMTLSP